MIEPLDLDAVRNRTRRAKDWIDADAQAPTGRDWLPLSVREHFARDVPNLLTEVERLRAELDQVHDPLFHRYLSTACLHGEHDQCRLRCKVCDRPCVCEHHGKGGDNDE